MELIQINIPGGGFYLEAPARINEGLPEAFDTKNFGRLPSTESEGRDEFARAASGGFELDSNRWLVTLPAHEVDYMTLAGASYVAEPDGALLLRKSATQGGGLKDAQAWHTGAVPVSFKLKDDILDVHLKVVGPSVPSMPGMVLEEQEFELPSRGKVLAKRLLNSRVVILFKRLPYSGSYMDIMCASVRMQYERMFAMFDIDGDGSVSAEEVSDALQGKQVGLNASELDIAYHYQQLLTGHMSNIAAHMDETQAGVVPSMDLAAFCEALERDHHQGRAWFVTGVAVNLPDGGNFREVARTVHLEQAAIEFDDKVGAVWEELDRAKTGSITLGQMQEAFEHLELPTPQETLDQLLEPFLAEGCVGEAPFRAMAREQFRSATVSFAQFKAQRQAKERQRVAARARARLLLFKGTERRVKEREVPCSHASINAGDVFLLDGYYSLYLWIGEKSGEHEAEAGREAMERLAQQRRAMEVAHAEVKQGHEPVDFWFILGGRGPIASHTAAISDDLVEGLPSPVAAHPSPRGDRARVCIVGAGVAGAACARTLRERVAVDVVVLESAGGVGGRCASVRRSGVDFSAGAAYFTAGGPHLAPMLRELLSASVVTEWSPRVGVVSRCGIGEASDRTLVPAMEAAWSGREVNVEAWLCHRPATGAPPMPRAAPLPASAFAPDFERGVSRHDLDAPNPPHRRSHAHARAQGHGSCPWLIGRPDMSALSAHLLGPAEVRTGVRVQAISPKLGQGMYEVIVEEQRSGKFDNAGLFDLVLLCVPHAEASRLLADVQPSLAPLPHSAAVQAVWVVAVAFDHPLYTPFDVLTVEDDVDSPVRFAFREASRLAAQDPFQTVATAPDEEPMINNMMHPKETNARLWGKHTPGVDRPRQPPAMNVYGGPADRWVVHLSPEWTADNLDALAKQVCQDGTRALLALLGMKDAQLRVLASDAVLWRDAVVKEPAATAAIRPGADPAFGPFCLFDPVTGIGAAGDWCVDGSVEGAFVSGRELAARAAKSPIIFKEGQSNPLGPVQMDIVRKVGHRTRALPERGEVVSGYSADSRPSTGRASQGWDALDWPEQLLLKAINQSHGQAAEETEEVMRKTALCLNEGCGEWVDKRHLEDHRRSCPYRRARKCPFFDCGRWIEAERIERHVDSCKFGSRVECEWCFRQIAQPDMAAHRLRCLVRPRGDNKDN